MAPILGGLVQRHFSAVLPDTAETYDVHESRGVAIYAGNAICQIVGTLFFFARVYSRSIIINSWKPEDTTLAVAWVLATAYSLCQYAQVYLGYGHHWAYIQNHLPTHSSPSQQWAFAAQLIMLGAQSAPKLSICLTYLRLFSSDIWGRRLIKCLIVVVVVPNIVIFFCSIFQCDPVSAYWTEGRPADKCVSDTAAIWATGGLTIFVDLALVFIVLPQVLALHLNTRQRWSLICIVGLGFVAAAAGTMRIVRVGTTLHKHDFDPSWDMYDISIWTAMEIYVSLICAAAPGMKPLVAKILPKLIGSTFVASHDVNDTALRSGTAVSIHPPGSVELKLSQRRRGTIGSARTRRISHESILEEGEGPYTEVEGEENGAAVPVPERRSLRSKFSSGFAGVAGVGRMPKITEVETGAPRDVP